MSLSKTIIFKSSSSMLNMVVIIMILTSSLCVRMVTSSSQVLTSRCASCEISELDDETFVWRYLGACMVCGEFYGSVVERCCMCNIQWFKDCQFWTGVDHLKQPDIKKYIHQLTLTLTLINRVLQQRDVVCLINSGLKIVSSGLVQIT